MSDPRPDFLSVDDWLGKPEPTVCSQLVMPVLKELGYGDDLFSCAGTHVARLEDKKAYGPDGRFVGTLVGNRLVYRSTDSATIGSVFARCVGAGTVPAGAASSIVHGEEPPDPRLGPELAR
jgi:hypothetical protein